MFEVIPKNDEDEDAAELMTALLNYTYSEIFSRMLVTGEPFELAFANYLEELQNDQMERP